jgi:hypothetical protein
MFSNVSLLGVRFQKATVQNALTYMLDPRRQNRAPPDVAPLLALAFELGV